MRRFRGETAVRQIELARGKDQFRVISEDLRTGKQFELTTNNVLLPTGLGRPRRVVEDNFYFQEILQAQQNLGPSRFPIYSNSVEAYNYFADRTRGPVESGRRFAIVGSGDSAAVLVEALAGLYKTGNLGEVDKIVVVASSSLSERCRYNSIDDLLERFAAQTGRKNLLEVIDARVNGIELENDPAVEPVGANNAVTLLDQNGRAIRAASGQRVRVDHVIEATGFESELEQILSPLLGGVPLGDSLANITPSGNPLIAVGQILRAYPGIAIVGTAARPQFNDEKQATLPAGTREVLRAVSENVVAIGLRGADTTVAVKSWLRSRNTQLPPYQRIEQEAAEEPIPAGKLMKDTFVVPRSPEMPPTDKTLEPNATLLTPLLLIPMSQRPLQEEGTIATDDRLVDEDGQLAMFERRPIAERQYGATITIGKSKVNITPTGSMPAQLARQLAISATDASFQAYALAAMKARRSSAINVQLVYKGSRLDLENSVVQAV
jgi:hypothetical protein